MKKYVQVGCGTRGVYSYSTPMVKEYGDCAELCGVYDINPKRAALVSEFAGKEIKVYDDYTAMLKEVKPDTVIVASTDCTHDKYAIEALEAGCDVIVEKPLTTTFEKALAIKAAEEKSGKKVTVTFNLRFHPFFSKLKQIVASGILGEALSVHYEWMLGLEHGPSYFRRWHSERENSGSLLVHKSTHHFDIANWLLEQDPVSVTAYGSRKVFGDVVKAPAERCYECKQRCRHYIDMTEEEYTKFYLNCEDVDGYLRDRCVYSDKINIEDTVSVNVQYSGGAVMSYTLSAWSPYEGMRLVLNGKEGRMEATVVEGNAAANNIKIYKNSGEIINIQVPEDDSSEHGGADGQLRSNLFRGTKTLVPEQSADLRAGLMSIGIGMAANISMAEKRSVRLDEFYKDIK